MIRLRQYGPREEATPAVQSLFEQASKPLNDTNAPQKMNECVKAIQDKVQLLQSLAPPTAAQPATTTPQQKKPEGR